jgi:glycosyltransferase involved in cell wall biosynthesis
MNNSLVSIIIPTKNAGTFLENCLKSIKIQTYKKIEVLIIDGNSQDQTLSIAKKYKATVIQYNPHVPKGLFDAPHRRNYGVKKAKGAFVYYLDADMELPKGLIEEAVAFCTQKFDAVILPEDSFGVGVWARAKNLERRCYWGDDTIEAPRFFKKSVWQKVGGLDESLGGGGDDWDLHQKLLDKGYKIGRTKSIVMHNEGDLRLGKLFRKRYMYGKDSIKYVSKRPKAGVKSYIPFRQAYLKNWRLFVHRPEDTFFFIVMRSTEYFAGFSGIIVSAVKNEKLLEK